MDMCDRLQNYSTNIKKILMEPVEYDHHVGLLVGYRWFTIGVLTLGLSCLDTLCTWSCSKTVIGQIFLLYPLET